MSKKNPAKGTEENLEFIMKLFENSKEIKQETNKEANKPVDELSNTWSLNAKVTELFETKINSDTKLKRRYAMALIILLIVMVIALNVWFVLKGIGILNFSDSTFNIFITGGLAEIFVLVKIIVTYLFNDNLTDLLKLILDRNNKGIQKENIDNKDEKN